MEINTMRNVIVVLAVCCFFAASAEGQQVDFGLTLGTLSGSRSTASATSFAQGLGGGTYFGFNGDVLIRGHLGFQGEVNWRTSQALYGGQVAYRPIFYDFNAIYSRRFSKLVGAEALAGIGAASYRFYGSNFSSCDYYGNCTNYTSSTHFMGDVGAGIHLYVYHNFFVRPEARLYLIHNNVEFSSGHVVRYGASIGYTFGGPQWGTR